MSGNTHVNRRSWYERCESEANENKNGYNPRASGWQTETEYEDAASQNSENYRGLEEEQKFHLQPTIDQRLRTIFQNSLYTDINFVINCGVRPKPSLRAHKAILAVGSPVFANMFQHQETNDQDAIINNTPFHAFKSVIEYLYTDEVYFESGRDAQVIEVLVAAKAFQVPALEARCISYLESSEVTEANVCSRLQLATVNKLEEYKKYCMQFIQEHTSSVIRSPDFLSSDLSTVRNICKLPKLSLTSEMELFEGVMEWVKAQPDGHNSKRKLLDPLLKHIRFLSMSAVDFSRIISTHPDIFTSDEALKVILYLSKPAAQTKATLPEWCSKAGNRCVNVKGAEHTSLHRPTQPEPKKVMICLRPVKRGFVPNLTCELALKCIGGNYRIKALKLSFGQPLSKDSSIEQLIISVSSDSNSYSFKEHLSIRSEPAVIVPFTQNLTARRGNVIHIRAEAISVKNYYFLQFDEENSFSERSPFECRLNSEPKGSRLFFISEVIFEDLPPRRRPVKSSRRKPYTGPPC